MITEKPIAVVTDKEIPLEYKGRLLKQFTNLTDLVTRVSAVDGTLHGTVIDFGSLTEQERVDLYAIAGEYFRTSTLNFHAVHAEEVINYFTYYTSKELNKISKVSTNENGKVQVNVGFLFEDTVNDMLDYLFFADLFYGETDKLFMLVYNQKHTLEYAETNGIQFFELSAGDIFIGTTKEVKTFIERNELFSDNCSENIAVYYIQNGEELREVYENNKLARYIDTYMYTY